MPHPNRDSRNAAWQAAHQWRARAANTQPTGLFGALKLMLVWLAFGALMIVGVVFGLIFLLVGWAMMPFMRHKMKKRMEQMRADRAQDIGGNVHEHASPAKGEHVTLEGSFEVKNER
ncbi:hypothetical protein [Vreelandella malpeensis]|uniref:Uncharacterized protein n=1 Tax=Vreelandella malpeensis TaxID=1172368 RepID=A0ABS8DP56_9GAMM|nr:hypothetical protein [Halomonas malpeensis]MCB8888107.1 hypothetical protein [Halomonas malpeensis]